MNRNSVLIVVVALLLSGQCYAQNQHKNQARGFNANGVYSQGDVDHINLFNGNLTVSIPIGQPYPVNGPLSYSFTLIYNSNPWSARQVCDNSIDQTTFFSQFYTVYSLYVTTPSGERQLVAQDTGPSSDPYGVIGESSEAKCWTIQDPNPATNAGLGWQLSFGKLYTPRLDAFDDRTDYTERSSWVYMSQDGSEHNFYHTLHEDDPAGSSNIWYTRDGSYLRLNTSPPANNYMADMTIEFPNGQKHFFKNMKVRNGDSQKQLKEIWEEKLRAIEDPFGNFVKVDYIDTNNDTVADERWEITDSLNRKHIVTFATVADGYQKVIQDIQLESSGGAPVHYALTYAVANVNRPQPHITPTLIPESTDTLNVPLLTAIKLPPTGQQSTGQQYSMPVNSSDPANAAYDIPGSQPTNTGLLKKLVLPTGAQIEWKYEAEDPDADKQAGYGYKYGFGAAARHYLRSSVGIRRRIVTINKGTVSEKVYKWSYDPKVGDNYPTGCTQLTTQTTCSPAEFVNKVTTPEGDYTYNYFSIWPYPYGGQGSLDALTRSRSDLHSADYSLPFTKDPRPQSATGLPARSISNDALNGYPLFLSQAIFDKSNNLKRSVYVRYESDVLSTNNGYGSTEDSNSRMAAMRTIYHDDSGVYAETQYLDFDGLGHFRQENLFGTFGSGDRRLNVVWYNRANGSYTVEPTTNQRTTTYSSVSEATPWLLETYDSKIDSDFTNYRSTTYFAFNDKGVVTSKRTLRNFETPSTAYVLTAKDVLIGYTYDSKGNLTGESYYGGDKLANVSTSAKFVATGPSEYTITRSYQCTGVRGIDTTSVASLSYYSANPSLKLSDDTIDCSTGMPVSSRDQAGVQTTFQYDELLRLKKIARQQGAVDKITYFDVLGGSTAGGPQVTVQHLAHDEVTPLGDELYKYDQLGRVFEQDERMPSGGSSTPVYRQKTFAYNGLGWKTAESEWNDGATTAGRQTKYENFDPFGRPTSVTAPDGTVTQVFYNGVRYIYRTVKIGTTVNPGSTVTVGPEDSTTVEIHDRQGRLWMVRESSGVSGANVYTTYTYNINNQIVSGTTPAQLSNGSQVTQTRTFNYDNLGNLRNENLPEVTGRAYDNYDTMGRRGTEYTGKSYLRYTYDSAGRMTLVEEQAGAQYRPVKDFVYYSSNSAGYSLGKVQTARRYNFITNPYTPSDPTELGVVVREDNTYYGIDGQLDRTTTRLNAETDITNHTINPSAYSFDQTFAYDPRGNLISQTYPQCTNATCTGTPGAQRTWRANYTYQSNRLTSVGGGAGTGNTDGTRYASTVKYHANGMLNSIVHGNNATDLFNVDPNYMLRQSKITIQNGAGTQLWTSGTYLYDGAGDVTKIGNDWYAYDKVGRVVEGTSLDAGGKKRRYNYDAFGNVTSYQTYYGITASGGNPILSENFTTNVQSTSNRALLNYDGAGNAMGLVGQSPLYVYDAVNMVKYAPGFTYLYAADDERVWSVDKGSIGDKTWFEDSVPAGAQIAGTGETWNWVSTNPAPYAGSLQHQSNNVPGNWHQHYFMNATATMKVNQGDSLFAYVYIDPQNPPTEVMLQWYEPSGGWEHRAYWGANQIGWGVDGTASRRYIGPMPAAGSWQRLEVPASLVGLDGQTVTGMAFTLFGGQASWDHAGQKSNTLVETITLRGLNNEMLREYQVRGGDGVNHWTWLKDNFYLGSKLLAAETPQGTRHYHLDHLGTPRVITDATGNPLPGAPYTSFPFGEDTSNYPPADSQTPPADEKLRFAGQEKNFDYSGLGLYYMHARYYLPGNAKFLSVDPGKDIHPAQPQSLNLYSYARNNPLKNLDPTGGRVITALGSENIGELYIQAIMREEGRRLWAPIAQDPNFFVFLFDRGESPAGTLRGETISLSAGDKHCFVATHGGDPTYAIGADLEMYTTTIAAQNLYGPGDALENFGHESFHVFSVYSHIPLKMKWLEQDHDPSMPIEFHGRRGATISAGPATQLGLRLQFGKPDMTHDAAIRMAAMWDYMSTHDGEPASAAAANQIYLQNHTTDY